MDSMDNQTRATPIKAILTSFVVAMVLVACSGDDRPFEEAIEASDSDIVRLEVAPLEGVIIPVTIGVGETLRFEALAFNPAGVEIAFDSSDRAWGVSDGSVASIDGDGLLTGVGDGVVDVQLNFGGIAAAPLSVAVSSATLASIVEIVGPEEPEACQTTEYTATGGFDDGTERTLTDVVWALAPGSTAELLSEAGDGFGRILLLPQNPELVTLMAQSAGQTLSRDLTVADNLSGVSFPAGLRAVDVGGTISLIATATFNRDGVEAMVDVSDSVVWSVTDGTGSATITTVGLERGDLTGVSAGTVSVTASCGAFLASQIVQIVSDDDDDDDGLSFESGTSLSLALSGTGQQLAVSTGSSFDEDDDVSDEVTWQSLDTGVVTVSTTGFVVPVSLGTADILVTLDGESAVLSITVF